MNRFHAMPLRLRLTLLMAAILTAACILLMLASIYGAREVYADRPHSFDIVEGIQDGNRVYYKVPRAVLVQQNKDFTAIGIFSAISVIVLGTVLTYWIAGRGLKPVTDLSKEIEEIDENRLFRQVEVAPSRDEVSKLALSFNRMIRKLEKAFLAHKNFSANAAHELKTPLAAMIANIEVLQLDANPTLDEYKETMDDTLKNAQRLSGLVNDLLKMNAEHNAAACEKFDAKAMLDQIIEDYRPELQRKSIQIESSIGGMQVYGDKPLLCRAFSNLIHNAIKYNKPGGVIKIAAAETDHRTRITIFDTGIGIPEDQIDKIFEPFYCVDESRSRELGGSGLGLSIVKSVVEKHGGEIQVRSEEDVYTSVVVTLPKP